MLINFFRAIILYIIVLIVMRLMGKREIGQLQPFELVISIMIADLASTPMTDVGTPITNGIIPILGLLVMHLVISVINMKRFTINELEERIRGSNVYSLGDVEYAILETSGQVTVIQKPEKRTTTPQDFNITPEYEGIPYDLVVDGRVMEDNLKAIGKDLNWLNQQLKKFKIKPDEALIVTLDGKGEFFCQKKER